MSFHMFTCASHIRIIRNWFIGVFIDVIACMFYHYVSMSNDKIHRAINGSYIHLENCRSTEKNILDLNSDYVSSIHQSLFLAIIMTKWQQLLIIGITFYCCLAPRYQEGIPAGRLSLCKPKFEAVRLLLVELKNSRQISCFQ